MKGRSILRLFFFCRKCYTKMIDYPTDRLQTEHNDSEQKQGEEIT